MHIKNQHRSSSMGHFLVYISIYNTANIHGVGIAIKKANKILDQYNNILNIIRNSFDMWGDLTHMGLFLVHVSIYNTPNIHGIGMARKPTNTIPGQQHS